MTLRGNAKNFEPHDIEDVGSSSVLEDLSVRSMSNLASTNTSNSSGSVSDVTNRANNTIFFPNEISGTNSSAADNNSSLFPPLLGIGYNDSLTNNSSTIFPHNNAHQSSSHATVTSSVLVAFIPLVFLAVCILQARTNLPSREHWRGAEIRARARRIYEQRDAKMARKAASPEERQLEISANMHKMQIVARDATRGQWKLGSENTIGMTTVRATTNLLDSSTLPDEKQDLEEGLMTQTSLGSDFISEGQAHLEEHRKTLPETTVNPEQTCCSGNSNHQCPDTGDSNDDNDDVCYICLDSFAVGDVVMWSRQRHSMCSHVFHEDCLMPWLLEKRENECPSCRACFIRDRDTGSIKEVMDDNRDENGNDRIVDENAKIVLAKVSSDGDRVLLEDDADIEEGYTFVISSGLIARVPNHHSALSVPVPFARVSSDWGQLPGNRRGTRNNTSDNLLPPLRRRAISEGFSLPSLGGDTATNTPSSSWDDDDANDCSTRVDHSSNIVVSPRLLERSDDNQNNEGHEGVGADMEGAPQRNASNLACSEIVKTEEQN